MQSSIRDDVTRIYRNTKSSRYLYRKIIYTVDDIFMKYVYNVGNSVRDVARINDMRRAAPI